MSFGYNIPLVTSLRDISPDVFSISRSEQVEYLSSIGDADLSTARAFYARNHVTSSISEFLRGALKRLAGQLAAYVAAKRGRTEPEEASAAQILGTAIQTERI
jgi:hypothetical protein